MSSTTRRLTRADVRKVATYQRVVLFCILATVAAFVLAAVLPPELAGLADLLLIGTGIVSAVFVYLLATKVYSTRIDILYVTVALVPGIGLIAMLVLNGKATTVLKAYGYKVGLLGASPPPEPADPQPRRQPVSDDRITTSPGMHEAVDG